MARSCTACRDEASLMRCFGLATADGLVLGMEGFAPRGNINIAVASPEVFRKASTHSDLSRKQQQLLQAFSLRPALPISLTTIFTRVKMHFSAPTFLLVIGSVVYASPFIGQHLQPRDTGFTCEVTNRVAQVWSHFSQRKFSWLICEDTFSPANLCISR